MDEDMDILVEFPPPPEDEVNPPPEMDPDVKSGIPEEPEDPE